MGGAWQSHVLLVAALFVQPAAPSMSQPAHVYHNSSQINGFLDEVVAAYPQITHKYSIGRSLQDRELWVLALGKSPQQHSLLQPELQYIGNIHGNEMVGRELLIQLIHYLTSNYLTNSTITSLLDTSRVHILISMNPDGAEKALTIPKDCIGSEGRGNANDVDLNRDFPDRLKPGDNEKLTSQREPETQAVMAWMDQVPFILSANLHGGALVASYPYDGVVNGNPAVAVYSRTEDDELFKHLAKVYSFSHHGMRDAACPESYLSFPDGITNGAHWYPLYGGMQDYMYINHSCMALTLEISCCKFPESNTLEDFWTVNKDALINLLLEGFRGVKGVVRNAKLEPIAGAIVTVVGKGYGFTTTDTGEYWRILLPGNYNLEVNAPRYQRLTQSFRVTGESATVLNLTLAEDSLHLDRRSNASPLTFNLSIGLGFLISVLVQYCLI